MGRPKNALYLALVGPDKSPLPEAEFALINGHRFTVDFNDIGVTENREFPIPGLRTLKVRVMEKYLKQKNVFTVRVFFNANAVEDYRFVVTGRTTIGQLAALVHSEMGLDAETEMEFKFEKNVVPYGKLLLDLYKDSMCSDGSLHVLCRFVAGPNN